MRKVGKIATAAGTMLASLFMGATSVSAQSDSAGDVFGAGMSAFMCICYAVAIIVGLGLLVFTVMMIVDVTKRDESVLPNKTMWMVLMIVGTVVGGFGWIVAIYYYFARKRKLDAMGK
ncbi:hypothetical protein JW766_02455 [Candidatus Dojkabacteria bacterium]|nr:hypothetical protein [Candidatus Dojkabacteria bacterium]